MYVVWVLGLSLCGALRTVLLWEHSDLALTAVLGAVTSLGSTKVSVSLTCPTMKIANLLVQGRGALFFMMGTLSLLLFDNDQSTSPVEHRESILVSGCG